MSKKAQPGPGPQQPQWSADGRWWWDGERWKEMWRPPRGLAWDGQSWSRVVDAPQVEPKADPELFAPPPAVRTRGNGSRSSSVRLPVPAGGNGHHPAGSTAAYGTVAIPPPPPPPPVAPSRRPSGPPQIPAPVRASSAPPPAPRAASRRVQRSSKQTLILVGSAMILMLVGITTDVVATNLNRGSSIATTQSSVKPADLAKKLVGKSFTRDVIPPELAAAPPLRDVFVSGQAQGLVGETTTATASGSVTIYVFSDPVWAQAFIATPQIPSGCNLCSSMSDAISVPGVGDTSTSYVLYRTSGSGKSWVGTATYTRRGEVVIVGLNFPLNTASAAPSDTDRYLPTAYAKAAIGLVSRAGG